MMPRLPLELTVNCCATDPLQVHSWILVPLAVPRLLSSAHLPAIPDVIGPTAPPPPLLWS